VLAFDPKNPFPLLPQDSHTYREAQLHSAAVDAWLGLPTAKVEQTIKDGVADGEISTLGSEGDTQEIWVNLPVITLLTPYSEIRLMLERLQLQPSDTVVDLGAGYGRVGFVLGEHYPEVKFIGYEFLKDRVEAGLAVIQRQGYKNISLLCQDLSDCDFAPAIADYYFIYDFGNRRAIEKILFDLQFIARDRKITVIGRGRATRDAIEGRHYWLSDIVRPEHFAHYSIYRSR
jgi:hypothetical protein